MTEGETLRAESLRTLGWASIPPRRLTASRLSCAGERYMCKRRSRLHSAKTPVTASNACYVARHANVVSGAGWPALAVDPRWSDEKCVALA